MSMQMISNIFSVHLKFLLLKQESTKLTYYYPWLSQYYPRSAAPKAYRWEVKCAQIHDRTSIIKHFPRASCPPSRERYIEGYLFSFVLTAWLPCHSSIPENQVGERRCRMNNLLVPLWFWILRSGCKSMLQTYIPAG